MRFGIFLSLQLSFSYLGRNPLPAVDRPILTTLAMTSYCWLIMGGMWICGAILRGFYAWAIARIRAYRGARSAVTATMGFRSLSDHIWCRLSPDSPVSCSASLFQDLARAEEAMIYPLWLDKSDPLVAGGFPGANETVCRTTRGFISSAGFRAFPLAPYSCMNMCGLLLFVVAYSINGIFWLPQFSIVTGALIALTMPHVTPIVAADAASHDPSCEPRAPEITSASSEDWLDDLDAPSGEDNHPLSALNRSSNPNAPSTTTAPDVLPVGTRNTNISEPRRPPLPPWHPPHASVSLGLWGLWLGFIMQLLDRSLLSQTPTASPSSNVSRTTATMFFGDNEGAPTYDEALRNLWLGVLLPCSVGLLLRRWYRRPRTPIFADPGSCTVSGNIWCTDDDHSAGELRSADVRSVAAEQRHHDDGVCHHSPVVEAPRHTRRSSLSHFAEAVSCCSFRAHEGAYRQMATCGGEFTDRTIRAQSILSFATPSLLLLSVTFLSLYLPTQQCTHQLLSVGSPNSVIPVVMNANSVNYTASPAVFSSSGPNGSTPLDPTDPILLSPQTRPEGEEARQTLAYALQLVLNATHGYYEMMISPSQSIGIGMITVPNTLMGFITACMAPSLLWITLTVIIGCGLRTPSLAGSTTGAYILSMLYHRLILLGVDPPSSASFLSRTVFLFAFCTLHVSVPCLLAYEVKRRGIPSLPPSASTGGTYANDA